jgi:hypothetical protein
VALRILILCDLSSIPKIGACMYVATMLSGWPFLDEYGTTRSGISKTGMSMIFQNNSNNEPQQGLLLSCEVRSKLEELVRARTRPAHHIERASILLSHADGQPVKEIATSLRLQPSKIYRCLNRARAVGIEKSHLLGDDLPRSGSPPTITPESTLWILSLACQPAKELGYSYERWTTDLLAKHARTHCVQGGHECLTKIAQGTIVKILAKFEIKPQGQILPGSSQIQTSIAKWSKCSKYTS